MANVRVWKQKNGRSIPIKNMSEDHIKNCIKLCERNGTTSIPVYTYLKEELDSRQPKTKKKLTY